MGSTSLERRLEEIPIAVVDLETTGLAAGGDRVVELSVVRIEPNQQPELILDTLINPRRPMAATEIHGIRDSDVSDAPTFEEVAGDFVRALHGAVLASYNVYFDARFLKFELSRVGIDRLPPHLCLMYLRPMLSLGSRCTLDDACRSHGIEHSQAHRAGADALAASHLWPIYLDAARRSGAFTFSDLGRLKAYKFVKSWTDVPYSPPLGSGLGSARALKSRTPCQVADAASAESARSMEPKREGREAIIHEYWDALTAVMADLEVSEEERDYLRSKLDALKLTPHEIRAVHARAFADLLRAYADDQSITDQEDQSISSLHRCLAELGWAPGLRELNGPTPTERRRNLGWFRFLRR